MAKKIALLIGVGKYGNGLKPLRCPVNGVGAMQALLARPEIGGFDQVIPLIDPDVGTMQAQIGEVFGQLTKQDMVLLYFTGHGIKDMSGNFYLSTAQTQLFNSGSLNPGTAVSADFVKGVVGNSPAERKVIILDCCLAAAFAQGYLGMDDSSVDVNAQLGGKGWCVLTASKSTGYALEQAGEDLSVYTRYLVEGMRTGGAAPDGQDFVSIGQLHQYVYDQLKTAAPAMEPAIFNAKQGEGIVIARVQVDNLQRYRKQVQSKVRNGSIRPSAKVTLRHQQTQLKVSDEDAAKVLEEVLKPFREKAKHVETYRGALIEEKEYTYPLEAEAIEELNNLKRLLNLRDEDVAAVEVKVLGHRLGEQYSPPLNPLLNVSPPATTFSFETVRVNEQGKVVETIPGEAECFTADLGNGITLEMVRIPGGSFMMGAAEGEEGASDDEYPQHRVTVPEFWMGKFAVTQAQWRAVAGLKKVERDLKPDPARFKGAKRPVENVSWEDAVEFCKRLSQKAQGEYRLPSEAEWEYACRAGTTTPFYFGPTITAELVNYDANHTYAKGPKGNYREKTTDVGSFPPNGFGLYDMHGNVWEWCIDTWHGSYEGAPTDRSAWIEKSERKKLLRGGSWYSYPRFCRAALRVRFDLDYFNHYVRFRVVSVAPRTL